MIPTGKQFKGLKLSLGLRSFTKPAGGDDTNR